MKDFTIGVLGGMGTFATIHLFEQYASIFPAEKEWERPRLIIDNRCTMPSRVKAFLYKEMEQELINEMADSLKHLMDAGCNRIVLACNTSHLFLPAIYEKFPELQEKVVHIIENCVLEIKKANIKRIYLLGSEGTIESQIYQSALSDNGIECVVPASEEYALIRECIEAVKQNKYNEHVEKIFLNLVNRHEACILGCTELPILYERYRSLVICKNLYDPLFFALKKLKEEYDSE